MLMRMNVMTFNLRYHEPKDGPNADMNAYPGWEPIRFLRGELESGEVISDLRDAFLKAPPVGRTFNGFKGLTEGEPIDYIFASPEVEFIKVQVDRTSYAGTYPSDHYPVVAEVAFS